MTLTVHYDRDLWLPIPNEWPWEHHVSFEAWRDELVRVYTDAYGYTPDLQTWLADLLTGLVRSVGANEHRFVFFPAPHEALAVVALYEIPRDSPLSDPVPSTGSMLGLDDTAAVRPPAKVSFTSALGAGEKCMRFIESGDERSISGVSHWLWRLPDRDILMIVGDSNLSQFDALQPMLDDFARSIELADAELAFTDERSTQ